VVLSRVVAMSRYATRHIIGAFTVKKICFGSNWLSNATNTEYVRGVRVFSVNTLSALCRPWRIIRLQKCGGVGGTGSGGV